jgi:hypothetical protein
MLLMLCLITVPVSAEQEKPSIAWGENLVKNGSFEQGDGSYYLTRRDLTKIDTDVVYRGLNALRLEGGQNVEKTDHTIAVQGFSMPFAADSKLLFRLAYRSENADAKHPASLSMVYKVANEKKDFPVKIKEPLVIRKDCDWTVYEVVLEDLPADLVMFGFNVKVPRESSAKLWIDDIQVRTYKPAN